jgi:hypothetical protein
MSEESPSSDGPRDASAASEAGAPSARTASKVWDAFEAASFAGVACVV